MFKLLVIDDEPDVFEIITHLFDERNVQVTNADTAELGLRYATELQPDVILLDIRLNDRSGLEIFHDLRRIDPKCLVIFITGHGTADTAAEAMKHGAHDYLVKPLDLETLEQVINQAFKISRLMHVPAIIPASHRVQDLPDQLVGSGAGMQGVGKSIGRVAGQDVNVLILGESGTGKELVARALYHHSRRNQMPFLALNCAALPETLLESELFGHEKGAFTGADRRRIGKFEQCHGGTLFLDEVGDMALDTQAKLLRLLEEQRFERLGGNETVMTDVRILAATNQNLEQYIEAGKFRKDLYYRLRGVTIHIPPLRDRREDISQLAHYYLFRFNRELDIPVQTIASETLDLLLKYDWPGNVRELQSVIREALLHSSGPVLIPEFLPAELLVDRKPAQTTTTKSEGGWENIGTQLEEWLSAGENDLYHRALEQFDRLVLHRTLQYVEGNQTRASERLGLSRLTLRSKLRAMNLEIGKSVAFQSPPAAEVPAISEPVA